MTSTTFLSGATFNDSANSQILERTYIGIISPSLDRFRWVDNNTANFRCPICGDSKKSKIKARGYIFLHKGKYFFNCKNCSASLRFPTLLKKISESLYDDFRHELIGGDKIQKNPEPINNLPTEELAQNEPVNNNGIVPISSLPDDHIAVSYCRSRAIPEKRFSELLYTDNFKNWVVEVLGAKKYAKRHLPWDKRLLLPLRDRSGNIIGVQGRALDKNSKMRYITIKKRDLDPKIFGLDKLNLEQPVFVVEGPIDSLFLPNCIAVCGGDLNIPLSVEKENVYCLFDNEPRAKDTIIRMENAINKGYNVLFWDIPTQYKDINDMVLKGGYSVRDILLQVKKNSARGAKAKVALNNWKIANLQKRV